ncbi:MAG: cobalt ECF transporter T component CbiQ [Solirubrobacterales bacterium]|nr:cobalt ECF transporter T component CbiQ [Solirubrobacterales bacterium]
MGGLCNHALELTGPTGNLDSRVHRLDPRAKILGLITVTLVAVSAPLERWPAYVACAAVLVAYAIAAGVGPRALWRRLRVVLLLVLGVGVLVPFVRSGGARFEFGMLSVHQAGLEIFAAVAAKAIIGTTSAALLGATTTFPAVLRGLEALRVPRLLVLIAAFMYRYLFVIVEELARMRSALVSRGYRPRTALQAGAMGRVAGAMFLRTYGRGERVYLAMLARGYNGTMPQRVPLRLVGTDVAFVAGVALIVLTARLTTA